MKTHQLSDSLEKLASELTETLNEHETLRNFCEKLTSEELSLGEIIAEAQSLVATVKKRG